MKGPEPIPESSFAFSGINISPLADLLYLISESTLLFVLFKPVFCSDSEAFTQNVVPKRRVNTVKSVIGMFLVTIVF
ncbi:hypothetical protein SDC9_87730 [bioreactor metagenome]|uniref:Uncharacterized protein n=1 Tax=bioreactor metagenome TaxID=1076179 RepID=A0A644ZJM2_9ZZZZ